MAKISFITPYLYSDIGRDNIDLSCQWRNPPLNVLLLATFLQKKGHIVEIIDMQRELVAKKGDVQLCLTWMAERLLATQPDIVGFSFFSVHVPEICAITKKIKETFAKSGIAPLLIAGGIHATVEPEHTLRELEIDYVCIGEGELALLALADGVNPTSIPGIVSLDKLTSEQGVIVEDLDSIPFPEYSLCDWKFYASPTNARFRASTTATLDIMFGRGCVFSCNFCAYRALSQVRYHSAEYLIDLIKYVNKETHVSDFYCLDSTLGTNRKLLTEFCEKLIAEKSLKIRLLGNMRANQVDEELLTLMQRAGYIYLFYGFESGSQDDLDRMNKKTKISSNYKAALLHNKLNFVYNASMLINYPGQTVADLRETEKFLIATQPPSIGINPYIPLPGCRDYDALKAANKLSHSTINDWRAIGETNTGTIYAAMDIETLTNWKQRLEVVATRKPSGAHMQTQNFSTEALREKCREIPATRQERKFSADLLTWTDEELLSYWEQCHHETCCPEIRGWYQEHYKNTFVGKQIADIGPGVGLDGIFFAQQGAHVTFVDIHQDNLALLKRLCKLKGVDAQYYYIDDFEKFSFPHIFDAFVCIGSLINAPFAFAKKEVAALNQFLRPGGKVLFLGYPYERFIASGAKDEHEFAKNTDGERTPWMEWYDGDKVGQLFGSDFTVKYGVNFGAHSIAFNFFELNKNRVALLPSVESVSFQERSLDNILKNNWLHLVYSMQKNAVRSDVAQITSLDYVHSMAETKEIIITKPELDDAFTQLGSRFISLQDFSRTVPVVDVSDLHTMLDFTEKTNYPESYRRIPFSSWRMEVHDSPIFRYLYRNFKPQRHLEFGTWQGAGTIYCLEECDATVWTINLPMGECCTENMDSPVYSGGDSYDLNLSSLQDWAKRIGFPQQRVYRSDSLGFIGRFYIENKLGHRVCQIYSDSTEWDTTHYPDAFFDSVLIDGGHSAEVVCHDTLNAMRLIRPGGLMLWHDCCPPVWQQFACTQGVLKGIQLLSPVLRRELKCLFWIQPSWILLGIKK